MAQTAPELRQNADKQLTQAAKEALSHGTHIWTIRYLSTACKGRWFEEP